MTAVTPEERAREFRDSRKTLHLATTGANGIPTASYAPFVRKSIFFYIYTSALSQHTKNLYKTGIASVLLIEDETETANLFASKRITYSCGVGVIERESPYWHEIMDRFKNKFGDTFGLIQPLKDFALFRLTPREATYIEGFGQAYRMSPDLYEAEHIRGTGPEAHRVQ